MTPEAKARRLALGIPVHETDADHEFHDGYCNCGAAQKVIWAVRRHSRDDGRGFGTGKVPHINLDMIERNEDNR